MPFRLGAEIFEPSRAFPEVAVRVSSDLGKTVFFFGLPDGEPNGQGIKCIGTGFFIGYEDCRYFATVKHIAIPLAEIPFLIRINKLNGESGNIRVDGDIRWFGHPDPDVDLVIVPFDYDLRKEGFDVRYLAGLENLPDAKFECGDFSYTVGLFQLLAGKRRNLPVVHSGNIALLPSDEKIPVKDWEKEGAIRQIQGYLVQSESIQGLSGAPVFARSNIELIDAPIGGGKTAPVLWPRKDIGILGVWQGAWDAKADAARAASLGAELRVPVGMGIVVPIKRLWEILEMPELKKHRAEIKEKREVKKAASLDSVFIDGSSTDDNPNHREDFTRLVGAASQKQQQDD